MAKTKMVSGVLAKDKNAGVCSDKMILFYPGLGRQDIRLLDNGWWREVSRTVNTRAWTSERWADEYDLKPPRAGTAFEVDLEL